MTWARFDDATPEHPKIIAAGGDAGWLHFAAVCYCNRHLTDGVIPKGVVSRLTDRKNPTKLARKLVEVGLWTEHADGYAIHDYLDYQTSREKVLNDRAASAERQRKGRERRASTTPVTQMSQRDFGEVTTKSHETDGASHAVTSPVPSHPILIGSRASEVTTPAADDPALKPQVEKPLTKSQAADISHPANRARLREWHANTCPNIDLERELDKFALHCQARNLRFADPVAAAQEWLLKARPAKATGTNPADPERPPPRPKPWTGDDLPDIVPDHARHAIANAKANLNRQPQETL